VPFPGNGADEAGLPLGDKPQDEEGGPDAVRPQERQEAISAPTDAALAGRPLRRTFVPPHAAHVVPVFQVDRQGIQPSRTRHRNGRTADGSPDRPPRAAGIDGPDLSCRHARHFPGAAWSRRWAMRPYRQAGSAATARSQYSRAASGFLSSSAEITPSL